MQGCVCQLLLVNALAYGLEMCMAAGTICIPPLLLQVGMEESYMTMVLGESTQQGQYFLFPFKQGSHNNHLIHTSVLSCRKASFWMVQVFGFCT